MLMRDQGANLVGEHNAFFVFCKHFLPCTLGKRQWGKAKTVAVVSSIATVSDEVFTYLVLENCWDKWDAVADHQPAVDTKFTNTTVKGCTNQKYSGWSMDGYRRYGELYKLVVTDRKSPDGLEAEAILLTELKSGADADKPTRAPNPFATLELPNELKHSTSPDLMGQQSPAQMFAAAAAELGPAFDMEISSPDDFNPVHTAQV